MKTFSPFENFNANNNPIFLENLQFFSGIESKLQRFANHYQLSLNAGKPAVQVIAAKNGSPIPSINGQLLNSRFNPEKEAERNVLNFPLTASHYVVTQLNFLYSVEAMLLRRSEELSSKILEKPLRFVSVVPSVEMLVAVLLCRRISFLKKFSHLAWIFLPNSASFFSSDNKGNNTPINCTLASNSNDGLLGWAKSIVADGFHGFVFFETKAATVEQFADQKTTQLKSKMLAIGKSITSNKITSFTLFKRWWVNALLNLPSIPQCDWLSSLRNKHKGSTFLVLASGPSLDEQSEVLQKLKKSKHSFVVIACDSALPILAALGVVPHYVVALDSGYYNTLDFQESYASFKQQKPHLLFHPSLYPTVLRMPLFSKCYCFITTKPSAEFSTASPVGELPIVGLFSFENLSDLKKKNVISLPKNSDWFFADVAKSIEKSVIPMGGSVASAACKLSLYLGAKNVVFMGLDMCAPYLHSHAASSMHDRFRLKSCNRLFQREAADFLPLQSYSQALKNGLFVSPSHEHYAKEMMEIIDGGLQAGVSFFSLSPYFFKAYPELSNVGVQQLIEDFSERNVSKRKVNKLRKIKYITGLAEMDEFVEDYSSEASFDEANSNSFVANELLTHVRLAWSNIAFKMLKRLQYLLEQNEGEEENVLPVASDREQFRGSALEVGCREIIHLLEVDVPPLYRLLNAMGITSEQTLSMMQITELMRQLKVFSHYSR